MRGGSALILALLLVAVVGLLAAALCERAVVELRLTGAQRDRSILVSIAESALVRTRFRLSITADWTTLPAGLYQNVPLFGGTYSVRLLVRRSDYVVARITAQFKGRDITLWARIEKPPPWWNTNWTVRCPIVVSNTTPSDLQDYQVRVVVQRRPEMRADLADLRFVADDQTTVLPYWIEFADASSAIVWVKVPAIAANGSTTIWLYYGNPAAASASSFAATMEAAYNAYRVSYNWVDRPDNDAWLTGLFVYKNLTLPFQFPFYGTFYNNCHITTTGYIRFPAGNYAVDRTPTEDELANRRMFAAYWGCFSGRHTYDGPGDRDIRYPGVYVYSYSDRVHVEWEVARVLWLWWQRRWVAVGGTVYQAFLYRNGDILFQMKFRYRAPGLAGVSKGDGSTYINTTSMVGDGISILYAQRKYVEPEPTARVGEPERLQLTRVVWLRYE